jgi:hypothetical protein
VCRSSGVGKGSAGKLDGRPLSLKRYSRPLLSCIEFVLLRMLLFVFSIPSGTEKLVKYVTVGVSGVVVQRPYCAKWVAISLVA